MGRKPLGFTARTITLPPELWGRLERFRAEQGLSSVTEAIRVVLWRALPDQPAPKRKTSGRKKTGESAR